MALINTLHILNKRPEHPASKSCFAAVANQDAVLLIENGVLALADNELTLDGRVYALSPDMLARAIPATDTIASAIGYDEMVALTTKAKRVISW